MSGHLGRLVGTSQGGAMRASLDDAIYLKDAPAERTHKVMAGPTAPIRIHLMDPRPGEDTPVLIYLEVFDAERDERSLKRRYRRSFSEKGADQQYYGFSVEVRGGVR